MKRFVKILTITTAVLFTAQSCNLLLGGLGNTGSGPKGVFMSVDSGAAWAGTSTTLGEGASLETASVSELFLERDNPGNMLAFTSDSGLFASDNGGERWVSIFPNVAVTSGFISLQDKQIIYAGGVNGSSQATIWKSTDRGNLWVEIFSESSGKASIASMAFDPFNPSVFYAALSSGSVIKSLDSGLTWRAVAETNSRPRKIVIAPDATRTLYIQAESSLLRSLDSGLSWETLKVANGTNKFNDLVVEPTNASILYAGTGEGMFRSFDSGNSWTKVPLPANQESSSVSAVAVNQDNPSQIYAAIRWTVYSSSDRGVTWKTVNLPTRRIVGDIAVDFFEPNKVYAGMR